MSVLRVISYAEINGVYGMDIKKTLLLRKLDISEKRETELFGLNCGELMVILLRNII